MSITLTSLRSVWTYEGNCVAIVETAWPTDNEEKVEMRVLATQIRDQRLRHTAVVARDHMEEMMTKEIEDGGEQIAIT